MKTGGAVVKSQFGMEESVEKSKDILCVGYLVCGTDIRYFEEQKKAGEITCVYCNVSHMITCLDFKQNRGQAIRRLAMCCKSQCPSLDCAKDYQIPVTKPTVVWKQFGVPETHESSTFENFKQVNSFRERAEKFCSDSNWCLTLHGSSGKGKTHLAVGLLKKFHNSTNQVAIFASTSQILKDLREAQSGNENEYRVIDSYVSRPFLVIDDLGSTRGTDWQIEKLYEIIDGRYAQRKKTIITTNLTFDNIEKIFGMRLMRRISDSARELTFN